jgi:hypothetical protein
LISVTAGTLVRTIFLDEKNHPQEFALKDSASTKKAGGHGAEETAVDQQEKE